MAQGQRIRYQQRGRGARRPRFGATRLVLYENAVFTAVNEHPVVLSALRQVAEAGMRDAKRRCPVDTGNLRRSIRLEPTYGGWRWGTDVRYAPYVEYGTYNHRAQPFLRPSVDAAKREAVKQAAGVILAGYFGHL